MRESALRGATDGDEAEAVAVFDAPLLTLVKAKAPASTNPAFLKNPLRVVVFSLSISVKALC